MKISELIKQLQQVKREHGDIEVRRDVIDKAGNFCYTKEVKGKYINTVYDAKYDEDELTFKEIPIERVVLF